MTNPPPEGASLTSFLEKLVGPEQVPGTQWEPGPFAWVLWIFLVVRSFGRLFPPFFPTNWLGIALIPFQLWCAWLFVDCAMWKPSQTREKRVAWLDLGVHLAYLGVMLGAGYQHPFAALVLVGSVSLLALQVFVGQTIQRKTEARPIYDSVFAAAIFVDPAQSSEFLGVVFISILIGVCFQRVNTRLLQVRAG